MTRFEVKSKIVTIQPQHSSIHKIDDSSIEISFLVHSNQIRSRFYKKYNFRKQRSHWGVNGSLCSTQSKFYAQFETCWLEGGLWLVSSGHRLAGTVGTRKMGPSRTSRNYNQ